jgi:hypothetical protein
LPALARQGTVKTATVYRAVLVAPPAGSAKPLKVIR